MKKTYPKHHMIQTGHIARCQICNSGDVHLILDLGHQPLCDTLLTHKTLNQPEKTYPLRMIWCKDCTGVQIDYCVAGEEVYHPDYPYLSSITKPLAEYQSGISRSLISQYKLPKGSLVVDIGSGDGALLQGFKDEGMSIMGVEPTNTAKIANAKGLRTTQAFFDTKTAAAIRKKHGPASLITSTNVFAHMQTLGEVVAGIHLLLKDGGVFISETHYLLDVVQGGQFDTIYHEHLRTYTLRSLIALFQYYDFTVTDVERGSRYGGNIRVHVTKGKGKKVSPRVKELLQLEKKAGMGTLKTYKVFADRVKRARLDFMKFLIDTKKKGKSIVGKSCPGRSSTLLNYYGVDSDMLPYLAEQPTSLKLGMYLPGKHIPVVDEKILLKEQPDYIVMMSWHYADVIMKRLKKMGVKSDFVIPLPDLRLVKNAQVRV